MHCPTTNRIPDYGTCWIRGVWHGIGKMATNRKFAFHRGKSIINLI
nr:MAG TPA: hypothetical protein [Caudoviricetes sp.]